MREKLAEVLVGQTIEHMKLEGQGEWADDDRLVFVLSNGREVVGDAEGDCCSESWFEHMDQPEALKGMTVEKVEVTKAEDLGYGTRQEYDLVWFIRIQGQVDEWSRAGCTIELRNSSNGHYGGWVSWHVRSVEPGADQ